MPPMPNPPLGMDAEVNCEPIVDVMAEVYQAANDCADDDSYIR